MKRPIVAVAGTFALAWLMAVSSQAADSAAGAKAKKLNVALITGGHAFNQKEFLKVFEGYDDIAYKHLPQRVGGEIFDDIAQWPYDVIVLYNFNQTITPKQQANFLKLLDKGVGLVILHHANAAYSNWPLFWKIAGVQYHFGPWKQDGKPMAASGYRHDRDFRVHLADPNHPITRGLKDYDIHDETYCRTSISPDHHVLLTTDEPTSDKNIGWVKTYAKSNVCYLQSGHDEHAYRNPNYRTLVARAIRWSVKGD